MPWQSYSSFATKHLARPTSQNVHFSAHSLALLQGVVEAPGCSATTDLLPSTSGSQDKAQVLHEQPSGDSPVLHVDILPRAQVWSIAAGVYITRIKC